LPGCGSTTRSSRALKRAAETTNKPVATEVRDTAAPIAAELKRWTGGSRAQGAEAQARALAASAVPVIIGLCNRRRARDARILVDGGYRITRVTPVDQFRYSSHVELVARFERS
jgi:23S rRNA (uracil1939-C5)-methyltransferase